MQPIQKFMLSSPAWAIFLLTVAGPLASIAIPGKTTDSLVASSLAAFSGACVSLWYLSTITAANHVRTQFRAWTLALFGVLLVCYVTLPFCDRIFSVFATAESAGNSSEFASTLIVVWGLAAGVGALIVAFFASKSLSTIEAEGKPRVGDILFGFLAFTLSPLGVWFLQPRLAELHRRAA